MTLSFLLTQGGPSPLGSGRALLSKEKQTTTNQKSPGGCHHRMLCLFLHLAALQKMMLYPAKAFLLEGGN